jgi:hypothetical protein
VALVKMLTVKGGAVRPDLKANNKYVEYLIVKLY